jgi:type IV secretory pathway ATPase VirB11/archaellum biosynthesis ATPase
MADAGTAVAENLYPDLQPLSPADLRLASMIRGQLSEDDVRSPDWRGAEGGEYERFRDAVISRVMSLSLDEWQMVDPAYAKQIRETSQDGSGARTKLLSKIGQRVYSSLAGMGVLTPLLDDPQVEEIFVRNGYVAIERSGEFIHLGKLADDEHFYHMAALVGEMTESPISSERPVVLGDLPGGQRLTAVVEPLSRGGTAINIRAFGRGNRALKDIEALGSFTYTEPADVTAYDRTSAESRDSIYTLESPAAKFLAWVAASLSGSMLIAGEFSSGKTTLLNALSDFFPSFLPVAVLETFQELQFQHPFLMRVVAPSELSPDRKGVTLGWVLNTVYTRMNPAVIAIGEIVSANEALEFLKASNLGRMAFSTIHGDSILAALSRLESLALAAHPELGKDSIRRMTALGLRVIVLMKHVELCSSSGSGGDEVVRKISRYVKEVAILDGLGPDGDYNLITLYSAASAERGDILQNSWSELGGTPPRNSRQPSILT